MKDKFAETFNDLPHLGPKSRTLNKRYIVLAVSIGLLVLAAGSASYIFTKASVSKQAIGEIVSLDEPNGITLKRYRQKSLPLQVPESARVVKNKADSIYESLEVGDTVRLKYVSGALGGGKVVSMIAASPFLHGRIIALDPSERTLTVKGALTKTFPVSDQTVILMNGSLAEFEDLGRGMEVKAEYRDSANPKLDMVLVEEKE